jgi:glycosyltransferase involved in cell wall biosynthesis
VSRRLQPASVDTTAAPLLRVAIDGRCFFGRRTGIGRYVGSLLEAMARAHPQAQFVCYTNLPIDAPAQPNIRVAQEPRHTLAPLWLHAVLPLRLRRDGMQVFWGGLGYVPCLGSPCPSVLTVHDLVHHFAPGTMLQRQRWNRRIFQGLSVARCNTLLAVSRATADDVEQLCGRRADDVIHPQAGRAFGLHAARDVPRVRSKYGVPDDYLITVATFEPRKNLGNLLRALLLLAAEGRRLPVLVLVGDSGWRSDIDQRIAEHAVAQGLVQRLGYVDDEDLPGLYAGARVSLFPALYEGFGIPVVEAQAAGTPVVHGQHASMIEAGGGLGLPVEGSVEALAAMMRALADGTLPLVSRLPRDIDQDVEGAAERLWSALNRTAIRN